MSGSLTIKLLYDMGMRTLSSMRGVISYSILLEQALTDAKVTMIPLHLSLDKLTTNNCLTITAITVYDINK